MGANPEDFQSAQHFGLLLFFLGHLLGFLKSLFLTLEDSLSSQIIILALLWRLLPLASHFSSLFSAASVFLPLNSPRLLSF